MNLSRHALPTLLIAFWVFQVQAASTYKWVDSDGKVHYGDAPPAQGKVLNRSERTAPAAGDASYCQGLQRAATVMATAMHRGTPSEGIPSALHAAELDTGESFRMDPAVQQQVVGYVYSFKHTRTSPAAIAGNVMNSCLNGIYNSTQKPRLAPETQTPDH